MKRNNKFRSKYRKLESDELPLNFSEFEVKNNIYELNYFDTLLIYRILKKFFGLPFIKVPENFVKEQDNIKFISYIITELKNTWEFHVIRYSGEIFRIQSIDDNKNIQIYLISIKPVISPNKQIIADEFVSDLIRESIKYKEQKLLDPNKELKSNQNQILTHVCDNPYLMNFVGALREYKKELFNTDEHLLEHDGEESLMKKMRIDSLNYCGKGSGFFAAIIYLYMAIEGFINTIYYLYALPEVKEEEIHSRIIRSDLDIKLKLMPIYCKCFKYKTLKIDEEVLKWFKSFKDYRNQAIHANILDNSFAYTHFEDGFIFTYDKHEQYKFLPIKSHITDEMVYESINKTQNMVIEIKKNAKNKYLNEFDTITNYGILQFQIDRDKNIKLIPYHEENT